MRRIRWHMDEDGSGTVHVFGPEEDTDAEAEEEMDFDALDDLPDDLASAIRDDGRERGQLRLV
jgi:hypothetical protein